MATSSSNEDNRLNRDPAEDVADRDPEVVRERRGGGDRDLRQVRRDRKQDRASERFPSPSRMSSASVELREQDSSDPDGRGRREEDQDERGETETREHAAVLSDAAAQRLP